MITATTESERTMKLLTLAACAAVLAGCATNYDGYAEANVKIAQARAQAESEKYKAMAAIASTGDAAAKVAAVMSMALGQPGQQQQQQIAPPKSAADTTLQAIATILPSIVQIYGINRQVALGVEQVRGNVSIQQSVSSALVANTASTNNAFVGIASKIQAPAANVTTTTTTTTSTDNTHTPTVVTQDKTVVLDPKVVTVEKPLVVNPTVVNPQIVQPVVIQPTTPK
jgi:hypothetical protein